ncbi:unnamed protein product [Vitrella brassicaformis CCMP3155]|uniref:Glycosyl transferase CAP10 domain-containing protein n=2 Tax=Vitrella brassicaformis TaxID=1169539 RepID=A0A0G4EAI9_VITBC|nr:unnamed protein product [Vitrella brassicaformis CCMP3155]|eukprot:CEL92630.1 unnamed protein product [Vitrella brassicaformis CCMP3155]
MLRPFVVSLAVTVLTTIAFLGRWTQLAYFGPATHRQHDQGRSKRTASLRAAPAGHTTSAGSSSDFETVYEAFYNRAIPPALVDKWRPYAEAQNCSTEPSHYASVDDGQERLKDHEGCTLAGEGREAVPCEREPWYWTVDVWRKELLAPIAQVLPDMMLVTNLLDEPRVLRPANGSTEGPDRISFQGRSAADTTRPSCPNQTEEYESTVGFFVSPASFDVRRGLLPMLSRTRVSPCFVDIVSPFYTKEWRPKADAPLPRWEDKTAKLVWRGSNTGCLWTNADDLLWKCERGRLVRLSGQRNNETLLSEVGNELRSHGFLSENDDEWPSGKWASSRVGDLFDVGMTGFGQCKGGSKGGRKKPCRQLEDLFGKADKLPIERFFDYKYVLHVDGNSYSKRLVSLLRSNSLVFLQTAFETWMDGWLQPWVHFVPVSPSLADLPAKLVWALEHDDEARQIAENAQRFAADYLRPVDFSSYLAWLLIEYESLFRPRQPLAGWPSV